MSIEKIKKDWGQHSKNYGAQIIGQKNGDFVLTNEMSYSYILLSKGLIELHLLDDRCKETYKLFTTFYEKLMKALDNE